MNKPYLIAKLLLLAWLSLSLPNGVRAQQWQATLSHYSTDNGLASNAIAYMTHDDYGYVWLATWNGVSRFDGFNFYNYKTGNKSGIKGLHNRVDAIVIDQRQNVWLKMYDGRIFVINRYTDSIEDPLEGVDDHDEFKADYFFTPFVTSSGDFMALKQTRRLAHELEGKGVDVDFMEFPTFEGEDLPHVFSVIYPDNKPGRLTIDRMLNMFTRVSN